MNIHNNKKALMLKRAFRRLKSGKGSILFFIIAIMSVMIVLASAVYYSMFASRKQVEIRYGSEQSYQSAVSLNDIVTDYLNANSGNAFVEAIINLDPDNESKNKLITTGSEEGGFAELAAGLGDYKVTITKLQGRSGDEKHVIKVETEVVVDGESSVVTSIGEFTLSSKPYSFDRFFTSTGYAPNDVFMSGMNVTSTMYLDNEYSQIGSDGTNGNNSGINIYAEIISAGTLTLNNAPINGEGGNGTEKFDITVGNNLILTFYKGQFKINLNGGKIRVGGNLVQGQEYNYCNTDVYVLGDYISGSSSITAGYGLYVAGDAAFFDNEEFEGPVYVNGDLFLDPKVNTSLKFKGGLYVGGNIYLCSAADNLEDQKISVKAAVDSNHKIFEFSDASIRFTAMDNGNDSTYSTLRANMDKAREQAKGTPVNTDVWPTDGSCESKITVKAKINEKIGNPEYSNWDMTKKFINEDGTYTVDPINYKFDNATAPEVQDPRFAGTGSNLNQLVVSAEKFGQYVIMGDVRITNDYYNGYNIVFDTTKADGNDIDMYVYLPANCYMTANPNESEKIWKPYLFSSEKTTDDSVKCFRWNNQPDGKFEGWFSVLTKGKGSVIFVVGDGVTYFAQQRLFMGHYNLLKETCPLAIKTDGRVIEYTDLLFTNNNGITALDAVEAIMRTTDTDVKKRTLFKQSVIDKYNGSGGLHNNIFIVAINKNSDVNFDMKFNTFCGYVYAPYMTFGAGKSTEGHFAMLGGLIVSDYEMPSTTRTYMATIPYDYYDRFVDDSLSDEEKEEARFDYMEKLIANSGGEIGTLGSSSSRSWRKYGYN